MKKVNSSFSTPKPNDPLTRHLLSSSQFAGESKRVKSSAFTPLENPSTGIFQTSVFQTKGLTENEVWSLGEQHVLKNRPDGRIHGRADVTVQEVLGAELDLDPDNDPPRHANIVGWPSTKAERKPACVLVASPKLLEAECWSPRQMKLVNAFCRYVELARVVGVGDFVGGGDTASG